MYLEKATCCLPLALWKALTVRRLKHLAIISTPEQVNQAIQGVVDLLCVPARCPWHCVLQAAGFYFGQVMVREVPGSPWVDCSIVGGGGKAIPGDCRAIAEFEFASKAQ